MQQAWRTSPHRFNVVPAGRRSGKTEIAKRFKLIMRALEGSAHGAAQFFAGAPTFQQAKRIWWADLKALAPRELVTHVSESDLRLQFVNGSEIWVLGFDKPERFEGKPWDGGVLDEFGNMKPRAWGENIRPALADRGGWCDFIGVPEGRNHYYELDVEAQASLAEFGLESPWGRYHWVSADILPPEEIAAARRELDELTFAQEFEASFVNFAGRAYHAFGDWNKARLIDRYDPRRPLHFCFDFNVEPGTATVVQEMRLPAATQLEELDGTAIIGEVWIPRSSDTVKVCNRLGQDWGPEGRDHQGPIYVYGDATGGAGGTAKVLGSDWDLVKATLPLHFGGNRIKYRVPKSNPRERVRLNAVNSRCRSTEGIVRLMVDPAECPHTVKDFEGVRLVEGGSGEIDKKHDLTLSHLTDGVGYHIAREHPVIVRSMKTRRHAVV